MREARIHVRHVKDLLKCLDPADAYNGVDCSSLAFLNVVTQGDVLGVYFVPVEIQSDYVIFTKILLRLFLLKKFVKFIKKLGKSFYVFSPIFQMIIHKLKG